MSGTIQLDDCPILLWVARSDVLEFSEMSGTPVTRVPATPGEVLSVSGVVGRRSAPPFSYEGRPHRQTRLR